MAPKNKKKKLKQNNDHASNEEIKTRKTRSNRKEINLLKTKELEEMDELSDDPEALMEWFNAQRTKMADDILKREEAMAEEQGKKAATYFQDIARHCKGILKLHVSLDPQTLRDVAIAALDEWIEEMMTGE